MKVRDENWSVAMKQKAREKKGAPPRDSVIKGSRTRPSRIPRSSPKTQKSHKSLEGKKGHISVRDKFFGKKKIKIMPLTNWCCEPLYYRKDLFKFVQRKIFTAEFTKF